MIDFVFGFELLCGLVLHLATVLVLRKAKWTAVLLTVLAYGVAGVLGLMGIQPIASSFTFHEAVRWRPLVDAGVLLSVAGPLAAVLAWRIRKGDEKRAIRKQLLATGVGVGAFFAMYLLGAEVGLSRLSFVPSSAFPWKGDPVVFVLDRSQRQVRNLREMGWSRAIPADSWQLALDCWDSPCWCVAAKDYLGETLGEVAPVCPGASEIFDAHSDLRAKGQRGWSFFTTKLGLSLVAQDHSTGHVEVLQFASSLVRPPLTHLTILPGDQLVFQWGKEVLAVDWNTRVLSVLGEGESPVAWPAGDCACARGGSEAQ